ncbi:MAG TPA: cysteine hydrolase [Pseudoclavibacter sp.]|nr:cysteine hydrolase [Pseudoclavibacter sp.]
MTDAPARTAVLVIDMQHVFADPDSPWATPGFPQAESAVARLVQHWGAQNTIFTRFVAPEHPRGAWLPYYEQWPFALQPADSPLWDIVPGLAEFVVRPTVDAATFGKWSPRLAAELDGYDRMLVAGVSTDCCVLSTVLQAVDAGVETLVVADACAGLTPEDHQRALDAIGLYAPLAKVVCLAEVF